MGRIQNALQLSRPCCAFLLLKSAIHPAVCLAGRAVQPLESEPLRCRQGAVPPSPAAPHEKIGTLRQCL